MSGGQNGSSNSLNFLKKYHIKSDNEGIHEVQM